MYGIFTVLEAVRQLRGETGERQLDDCDLAVAHGTGGLSVIDGDGDTGDGLVF